MGISHISPAEISQQPEQIRRCRQQLEGLADDALAPRKNSEGHRSSGSSASASADLTAGITRKTFTPLG